MKSWLPPSNASMSPSASSAICSTPKSARSRRARSKYQLSIAMLPLAKDLNDFHFEGTPINQTLVNDLAAGGFIALQRNAVLVGGTGTGKTHLAIAIARSCIRSDRVVAKDEPAAAHIDQCFPAQPQIIEVPFVLWQHGKFDAPCRSQFAVVDLPG